MVLTYALTVTHPFLPQTCFHSQESVSEDPFLNGLYASNFVRGLQGDVPYGDGGRHLLAAATCKHLAVYNLEVVNYGGEHWTRHRFQANVTRQELAETYLPAFRTCVEGGHPQQLMCAYNSIGVEGEYNSTPSCLDHDLLTNIVRGTWNFQGSVVADCDAVSDAYSAHHWGPITGDGGNASAETVVVAGLTAGCDMDCGSFYTDAGPAAVAQGLLRNATIDRALRRIFTMRIRLGEFDPPADVPYSAYGAADCDSAQGRALALQAAREAIVLLNNSLGLLPLLKKKKTTTTKSGFNRIAVLGPLANSTAVMMGGKTDYSPSFTVTALAGIRSAIRRMNVSTIVDYSPGLSSAGSTNASLLPAAIALASASDLVIVVVGISGANEGEGHDRANTTLPGLQVSLFFPFIS